MAIAARQPQLWEQREDLRRNAEQIYDIVVFAERLKNELRHSWLSGGRQESVADHCWQMALMAMLVAPHLEFKVNLAKAVKMILIHDLVEAEVGDIPATEVSDRKRNKAKLELQAISNIRAMIGDKVGKEIESLWMEFEYGGTRESKLAKALDNLEVQLQHNVSPLSSWEEKEYFLLYSKMDRYCDHDDFLKTLCEVVKEKGEEKLVAGGVDVELYKIM